jgi:hypothetical protein
MIHFDRRKSTHNVQIIKEAVENISYVLNLKGQLRVIVIKAYVRALEYTHGTLLLRQTRFR